MNATQCFLIVINQGLRERPEDSNVKGRQRRSSATRVSPRDNRNAGLPPKPGPAIAASCWTPIHEVAVIISKPRVMLCNTTLQPYPAMLVSLLLSLECICKHRSLIDEVGRIFNR